MKWPLYMTALLNAGVFAGFLVAVITTNAYAEGCYDSGPTYVCTGGEQYECMTTKCCTTEYVTHYKPDGTLEYIPKETCRVTNTSCNPNSEQCER